MRVERAGLLVLVVLAVLAALDASTLLGTEVAETTFDSGIFLRCAEGSPLELDFYTAVRPPTVPLLYKLAGSDPVAIRTLQSAVSVLAWAILALALASLFEHASVRVAVFAATCLFSFSTPINQWDGVLMSESLFLSLLAGSAGLSILLVRRLFEFGRVPVLLAVAWFVATEAFVLSRDSAAYLAALPLAAGVVLLAVRLVRGRTRAEGPTEVGGLALLLVAGALAIASAQASMHASNRWHTPLVNVILQRVLPDAELHETWVERYDLPRNAVFEGQAGRFAWNRVPGGIQLRKLLRSDPELADVQRWLNRKGVRSYQRHLVLDEPLRSLREALLGWESGVNPQPPVGPGPAASSYSRGAGIAAWNRALTAVTYVPLPKSPWWGAGALVAALLLAALAPRQRAAALTALLFLLGAASQAFVTWHGDTAEVARHTLVVGVLARIAFGLVGCVILDVVLTRRGQSSSS